MWSLEATPAELRTVTVSSGTGKRCPAAKQDVLVRAETRAARLEAQQAEKAAVSADDRSTPPAGRDHRPARLSQAGPGWDCTALKPPKPRGRGVEGRPFGYVTALHDGRQVPGRTDDQRSMDMIIIEELHHIPDRGGRGMRPGGRKHRLRGCAASVPSRHPVPPPAAEPTQTPRHVSLNSRHSDSPCRFEGSQHGPRPARRDGLSARSGVKPS